MKNILNDNNIYKIGDYLKTTWHSEDSPWKANQISSILEKNKISPSIVSEVGCGAGRILFELSKKEYFKHSIFYGYDIAQDAITLCKELESKNCHYILGDFFKKSVK